MPRVGDRRAFLTLLARIHRARPGDLPAAGALVMQPSTAHRQVLELQAEQLLVGAKHRQA
jgi:hypothetical protein